MPKILDTTERFGGPHPLCQCSRHGEPCEADPTAEDLRCDRCRGDRCSFLVVREPDGTTVLVRHVLVEFEVLPC